MTVKNLIDTESELLNIVDYVKQTWVLPEFSNEELISFIRIPFEAGLEGGKNWCKNTDLFFAIYDLEEERTNYLEKKNNDFLLYDGYYQMLNNIIQGFGILEKSALEFWDYEKFCSTYINQVRKLINSKKIHPKPYGKLTGLSYSEIRKDFCDFDTLGYWEKKDNSGLSQHDKEKSLFKGINFKSSPFLERTTLHYILQSDVNQGRDPLQELVSAIITYGLNIAEFNNTLGSIEVIKSIKLPDNFSYNLPELPKHKFLQACHYVGDKGFKKLTPEIKEQNRKHKEYITSLKPEELAKMKEKENKKFNDMINSVMNNVKKEKKVKKNLTLSEVYQIIDIKNF